MVVVYQVNNLYIFKDLIFRWAVSVSGEKGTFLPIKSLDIDSLNALYEISYPAYMPREFKQSLHEEIQARKSLHEEIQARKLMAEFEKDSATPPIVFQELDRTNDKYKLLCEIMSKLSVTGDQSCADLGYLIFYLIQKQTTEYEIVYRVSGKPDHHECFKNLDVCLAYILKRWW